MSIKLGLVALGLTLGTTLHFLGQGPRSHNRLTQTMEKVEEAFNTASTQSEKEQLEKLLTTAYRELHTIYQQNQGHLPKKYEQMAARIFYCYGRSLYGGDMEASKKMFQLSLTVQLVGLNALPALPTLKELPKILVDDDALLMQIDEEKICSSNDELAFSIATTLRFLGHTYQNIDRYKSIEHLARFEKIYGTAQKILARLNTPESRWEAGQLIYNTGRFIHNLKHPGDVDGALDTLKAVFPYLEGEGDSVRAKVLRAQIHNITGIELSKIVPKDEADKKRLLDHRYAAVLQANRISTETEGFDPFLKTMFKHNKAACEVAYLEAGIPVVDKEETASQIKEVLAVIEQEQYNHYYHANYVINAARFEMLQGNKAAALGYLELAQQINEKYPKSSAELQIKVVQLRDLFSR